MEEWIKGFEAKELEIKIQNEPIPNDWDQKLTAALAAGAAPDVAAVFGHWSDLPGEGPGRRADPVRSPRT